MGLSGSLSRRHFLGTTGAIITGLSGCATGSPAPEPTDDWPTWRHDAHRTGVSDATGPTAGEIAWKRSFESRPAPPVIAAETLVVGVDDKMVYGLARADGSIKWKDSLLSGTRNPATIVDDTAYVPARTGFYAYDLETGTEQWNVEYPAPGKGHLYHTPAAVGDSLYAGTTAFTYHSDPNSIRFEYRRDQPSHTAALSITDGSERWSKTTGPSGRPPFVPAVANDTVFVGRDKIYALDTDTGETRWTHAPEDIAFWRDPAVASTEGLLVVPGERDEAGSSGVLVAIDIETGREDWRVTSDFVPAPPALTDDTVFLVGDHSAALDLQTGEARWTAHEDQIVAAPPAITSDHIYVATAQGSLHAVDITTGEPQWQVQIGPGLTGPAVSNGRLYIATAQGAVVAVE